MASKRVPYLNSAKPRLLPEPNFSARKRVFWKVVNFPFRFFPRWKWYFRSNHDWKFSFLVPDGISGKKSTVLRILREYSQILQLVPRILKCTLEQTTQFKKPIAETVLIHGINSAKMNFDWSAIFRYNGLRSGSKFQNWLPQRCDVKVIVQNFLYSFF